MSVTGSENSSGATPLESGVVPAEPSAEVNPLRARFEMALRTLQSLRHPTLEQIERKLFLEEYLKKKF
jgi:hypothetical protein